MQGIQPSAIRLIEHKAGKMVKMYKYEVELMKLKVVLVYVWQHISIVTAQLKEALQSSRAVLRTHSLIPMRK